MTKNYNIKWISKITDIYELEAAIIDCKNMTERLYYYSVFSDVDVGTIKCRIYTSVDNVLLYSLKKPIRKWLGIDDVKNKRIDLDFVEISFTVNEFLEKYNRAEKKVYTYINKILKLHNNNEPVNYIKRVMKKYLTDDEITYLIKYIIYQNI